MLNLGFSEFLIIAGIALLIFGPDKLPGLIRGLGKGMTQLRRTVNDFKHNLNEEVEDSLKASGTSAQELQNLQELRSDFDSLRTKNIAGLIEEYAHREPATTEQSTESRPTYQDADRTDHAPLDYAETSERDDHSSVQNDQIPPDRPEGNELDKIKSKGVSA